MTTGLGNRFNAFTAIGVGTEVVSSGELGRWLRMNQVIRSIGRLSGHYVICAYGRVGRAVLEERAQGLICAVDSDAANVYITLIARALNPDPAQPRLRHPARGGRRPGRNSPRQPDDR